MTKQSARMKIAYLKIRLVGVTASDCSLYANGRHQCEVVVDVIKEIEDEAGVWSAQPLNDDERASITLGCIVEGVEQGLPSGWKVDVEKNVYSVGIWHGEEQAREARLRGAPISNCRIESISRYLRFDAGGSLDPVNMVARITLGAHQYTTFNGFDKGLEFKSEVTLQPIPPLIINAVDLEWFVDNQAYSDNFLHVKVHYWTPRGGLYFEKNMGLDEPCSFPYEGRNLDESYIRTADWGGQLGSKAGVIVNKDSEGHELRLSDIIQSPFNPAPDPYVNFNKRSTIMRAASVFGPLNTPDLTSTGVWRLIGNYGTEQSYLLLTSGPEYFHELVLYDLGAIINPPPDPEPLKTRLVKFEISLPGGHIATDALYANNRHQCKVNITVVVEKQMSDGGWERVPLTAAQRNSLSVTLFSAMPQQQLPTGWSCDNEKNKYDTGLWGANVEEEEAVDEDIVDLYMRVAPGPLQSQRFMARITLDGIPYTSNPLADQSSWVIISPVRPYSLGINELTRYLDSRAYAGTNPTVTVMVYYWTPPSGVSFVDNLGIE